MFFSADENREKIGTNVLPNVYHFSEFPMLDCNQYILQDPQSKNLALFDAGNGISFNGLVKGMAKLKLDCKNITEIYITHEHIDHVVGLYKIMDYLDEKPCKIFAYGETFQTLQEGNVSKIFPEVLGIKPSMFGINIRPLNVIRITENEQLNIGSEFSFQVFHTPGHSNGSVCYYEQDKKILIPGDLIFTGGSFGRYDFPGGSLSLLINSIKRMNDLDVDFLLPGHMSIGNGNGNQQIALSYKMVQSIGTYFR